MSSFQKTKRTQTGGPVFADRIEQFEKKTNFELELVKILDSVLDGYGKYTSTLATFKAKSLWNNHFLNFKEICINHLVVQMM